MDEEKVIPEEGNSTPGWTEEQEKQLEETLKAEFEKVRNSSMIHGARMVAGVVIGFAKDKKKPYNQRLNTIIKFCNTVMSNTKKRADEIGMKLENDEAKDE